MVPPDRSGRATAAPLNVASKLLVSLDAVTVQVDVEAGAVSYQAPSDRLVQLIVGAAGAVVSTLTVTGSDQSESKVPSEACHWAVYVPSASAGGVR